MIFCTCALVIHVITCVSFALRTLKGHVSFLFVCFWVLCFEHGVWLYTDQHKCITDSLISDLVKHQMPPNPHALWSSHLCGQEQNARDTALRSSIPIRCLYVPCQCNRTMYVVYNAVAAAFCRSSIITTCNSRLSVPASSPSWNPPATSPAGSPSLVSANTAAHGAHATEAVTPTHCII